MQIAFCFTLRNGNRHNHTVWSQTELTEFWCIRFICGILFGN